MNLKELREKLGSAGQAIVDLRAKYEGRALTSEEQGTWDKANADYDGIKGQIAREERAALIAAPSSANVPGRDTAPGQPGVLSNETRALAMSGAILRSIGQKPSESQSRAMAAMGADLDDKGITYRNIRAPHELRNMNTQVGADGGFLQPTDTISQIERAMLFFGGIRNLATVMPTDNGNPIEWPISNGTGNRGRLLSEGGTVTTTNPTIGHIRWDAYTWSSDAIKFSWQLAQDSPSLESFIGEEIGERYGRGINYYCTLGTGASQPKGIVPAATVGKTTASGTAIAADEVIELLYSVDRAYRDQGAVFMMNDGIIKTLRLLKGSGSGDYLWQPGMVAGQPEMLNGYPVISNSDMQATVATGTRTILFGAMRYYKIREVRGMRFQVLNELYAAAGEIAIQAFARFDGNLLDAGTHPVKCMLQA